MIIAPSDPTGGGVARYGGATAQPGAPTAVWVRFAERKTDLLLITDGCNEEREGQRELAGAVSSGRTIGCLRLWLLDRVVAVGKGCAFIEVEACDTAMGPALWA